MNDPVALLGLTSALAATFFSFAALRRLRPVLRSLEAERAQLLAERRELIAEIELLASRHRRGRPPWTPELFTRRYEEALAATPEPRTLEQIAEHFCALDGATGIDPRQLRRLQRRYGQRVSPHPE